MKYRNQTKIKMIGLVEILFYLLNKIIKKRVVPRAMNGFSALNKSKVRLPILYNTTDNCHHSL